MNKISHAGKAGRISALNYEVDRLLNLICSRLRRKELALAEENAKELLEAVLTFVLREEVARMNRLNRLLLMAMKLLLLIVVASILCVIMDIQPLLGLKTFAAGTIVIASLIVINRHLIGRFYLAIQLMEEAYEKVGRTFVDLLLDPVCVNNNAEATLRLFRLAVMRRQEG